MSIVVIDTNVLVSAAANPVGRPARLIEVVLRRHALPQSAATFREFTRTLLRPEFDSTMTRGDRLRFIGRIRSAAEFFAVEAGLPYSRDPRDDMFLHLALASDADFVVTGDSDLLALDTVLGIPILTPSAFLKVERFARRGRRTGKL